MPRDYSGDYDEKRIVSFFRMSTLKAATASMLYDPVSAATGLFFVFVLAAVLLSPTVLGTLGLVGVSCSASLLAADERLTDGSEMRPYNLEIAMLGASAGCLISNMFKTCSGRIRHLRRAASAVGTAIFMESVITYAIVISHATVAVCEDRAYVGGPAPYGAEDGTPTFRVAEIPFRYIYWMCSTPPILAMMGALSRSPSRDLARALVADALIMVFGLGAALTWHAPGAWYPFLLASLYCNALVLGYLVRFLRNAHSASSDGRTRVMLTALGPLAIVLWLAFPAVWLLCSFGVVSHTTSRLVWPILDVSAKAVFTEMMVAGDYSRAEEDLEHELADVDRARAAAEASTAAKRTFMRYIFHELRVPLNAVLLGIEDLYGSLTDVESAANAHWRRALGRVLGGLPWGGGRALGMGVGMPTGTLSHQDTIDARAESSTQLGGPAITVAVDAGERTMTDARPGDADRIVTQGSLGGRPAQGSTSGLPALGSFSGRPAQSSFSGRPARLVRSPSSGMSAAVEEALVDAAVTAMLPSGPERNAAVAAVRALALVDSHETASSKQRTATEVVQVERLATQPSVPGAEQAQPQVQSPVPLPDFVISEDPSCSGGLDTLDLVYASALGMGKLLDDFLSLEKIEEGRFELEPSPFRVADMVTEAARTFAKVLARKGLHVHIVIARDVPITAVGDRHRQQQVVSNYLSNAIKFSVPQEEARAAGEGPGTPGVGLRPSEQRVTSADDDAVVRDGPTIVTVIESDSDSGAAASLKGKRGASRRFKSGAAVEPALPPGIPRGGRGHIVIRVQLVYRARAGGRAAAGPSEEQPQVAPGQPSPVSAASPGAASLATSLMVALGLRSASERGGRLSAAAATGDKRSGEQSSEAPGAPSGASLPARVLLPSPSGAGSTTSVSGSMWITDPSSSSAPGSMAVFAASPRASAPNSLLFSAPEGWGDVQAQLPLPPVDEAEAEAGHGTDSLDHPGFLVIAPAQGAAAAGAADSVGTSSSNEGAGEDTGSSVAPDPATLTALPSPLASALARMAERGNGTRVTGMPKMSSVASGSSSPGASAAGRSGKRGVQSRDTQLTLPGSDPTGGCEGYPALSTAPGDLPGSVTARSADPPSPQSTTGVVGQALGEYDEDEDEAFAALPMRGADVATVRPPPRLLAGAPRRSASPATDAAAGAGARNSVTFAPAVAPATGPARVEAPATSAPPTDTASTGTASTTRSSRGQARGGRDAGSASPGSSPEPDARSRRASAFLRIGVQDFGVGISAADKAKLFQPFTQIRAGALQKGGGTGLGLSICKRIIELSGGRVGVDSAEGAGSTFWFEVPLQGPPASSCASTATIAPAPVAAQAPQGASTPGDSARTTESAPAGTVSHAASGQPQALTRGSVTSRTEPWRVATTDSSGHDDADEVASVAVSRGAGAADTVESGGSHGHGQGQGALPADTPPVPGPDAAAAGGAAVAHAAPPLVPLLNAVVVDDVKSNRELFARLLRRRGVTQVAMAGDGAEAVGLARSLGVEARAAVQVWFLDKEMPRVDGHGAARALRALGVTAPIIGVTGNALAEDRAEFIAAGANAVLPKPVRVSALQELLAGVGFALPNASA